MGGWYRMGLDDDFQIRQAIPVWLVRAQFCSGARWARFSTEKKSVIVYIVHL